MANSRNEQITTTRVSNTTLLVKIRKDANRRNVLLEFLPKAYTYCHSVYGVHALAWQSDIDHWMIALERRHARLDEAMVDTIYSLSPDDIPDQAHTATGAFKCVFTL